MNRLDEKFALITDGARGQAAAEAALLFIDEIAKPVLFLASDHSSYGTVVS